jgi:O-6-methylguanine DNA methyltransferase
MKLFHLEVHGAGIVVHAWSSPVGLVAVRLGAVPEAAAATKGQPVEGIEIDTESDRSELADALAEYLRGRPLAWDGSLDLRGVTGFQRSVFEAVRGIPFGEIRTYSDVARRIGRAGAVRAVGNALHRNPFPLVVPCHRVLREGGGLGGYSCGPAMKRRLLAIEHGQTELDLREETG